MSSTKIGGASSSSSGPSSVQSSQSTADVKETAKTPDTTGSSSAARPTESQQQDSSRKVAEHMLGGQMMGVKLTAQAERELPPVGKNQKVDITNPEMRNQLLRSCPQVNSIADRAGNSPDICGGAAMANALVLSSKDTDHAKANATAVRDLANSFKDNPVKLSKAEDQALKNMETGKMSPTDVQHLQQVMYRIGQRMPLGGSNPSGTGLSTTQLGSAMTMLSARGAFKDSNVTMHCNRQPSGFDHWTVSVDRTYANSQGPNNKSIVHGGPPPEVQKGRDNWQNEISVDTSENPPKVNVQFKQGNDGVNQYHETKPLDVSKFKDPEQMLKFEEEMRRAANGQPVTI